MGRVTLERRGLDRLPPEDAEQLDRRAWIEFMRWFREYAAVTTTS